MAAFVRQRIDVLAGAVKIGEHKRRAEARQERAVAAAGLADVYKRQSLYCSK